MPAIRLKQTAVWAPAVRAMLRARRVAATVLAVLLALVFGWHAFFGQNGITAYAQKRSEDRALESQIHQLTRENAILADRVQHLETDPDAVEMEARRRLHYTRPGEVIYPLASGEAPPAPQSR